MTDTTDIDTCARIIEEDTLELVTDMLLVGLQSYGEVERLTAAADICELGGRRLPRSMRPIDPAGDPETISKFADALRLIRNLRKSSQPAY
ncbi:MULTISPECIES: hypothetical protein [unclassified Thiocapsa]|uniref:hypothetical protein n=1 Tax=unclassified Thiocapsa TaxID=2641286 RepID=UPI0035B08A08